jgi:hypothetical protein
MLEMKIRLELAYRVATATVLIFGSSANLYARGTL